MFLHGVASGDPSPGGVVLWTRVTPERPGPLPVTWRVYADAERRRTVVEGACETGPAQDFTVHADVTGLEPATTYWFDFESDACRSPAGRTRTGPAGTPDRLRLGLASCASWPGGFFNAYGCLARREVDLVLHFGDYVYEDPDANLRTRRAHDPPWKLVTLGDYRRRHAQYKTDPQLQILHARHPVVASWDDHDIADNAWSTGATGHDPERDGDWGARKAAAVQAWLEWLPVRLPDAEDPGRIHRTIRLGALADLFVLDTRLAGREPPPGPVNRPLTVVRDRERSMLGRAQLAWLTGELASSTAAWRLIASQVMMAPLALLTAFGRAIGVNAGQWDGYPAEREALLASIASSGRRNVVVLSGDIHSSWAAELAPSPGRPPVATELVTPSVSSPSFADIVVPGVPGARRLVHALIRSQNPHLRFIDLEHHGYVVLDVRSEAIEARWWHLRTVDAPSEQERLAAVVRVEQGRPRLSMPAGRGDTFDTRRRKGSFSPPARPSRRQGSNRARR